MKILKPVFYDEFHCIGKECQFTCCQGWTIWVEEQCKARYQGFSDEIAEFAEKSLIPGEHGYRVEFDENRVCPLLNRDGWCKLVAERGEQELCRTCATFPRMSTIVTDTEEQYLSHACPAVIDLLYRIEGPLSFVLEEDDRKVVDEGLLTEEKGEEIEGLFDAIEFDVGIRDCVIDVLQDRSWPLWFRQFISLFAMDRIKEVHKRGDREGVIAEMHRILGVESLPEFFCQIDRIPADEKSKFECMKKIFADFQGILVMITGKDKDRSFDRAVELLIRNDRCSFEEYRDASARWREQEEEQFDRIMEHVTVYNWYANALKAMNEYYLLDNLLDTLLEQLLIKHLSVLYFMIHGEMTRREQTFIIALCVRMVSHGRSAMEEMIAALKKEECFSVGGLLILLK